MLESPVPPIEAHCPAHSTRSARPGDASDTLVIFETTRLASIDLDAVPVRLVFGSWEPLDVDAYRRSGADVHVIEGGHAKHLAALAFEQYLMDRFAPD